MSEAAIVYSTMNSAASKADNVARKIDSYSDEITKKVLNKLNNYGGDWSGNLSDARSSLNAKINSLNSDYNSYKGYASDIRTAVNQCKQTDNDVRETVKNLSSTFKVSHGIRDNVVENFFSYICTSIGNSNPVLRFVSDTLETIGEAGSELFSYIKTWWNYDGGKQLVTGVAVAVLEIVIGVASIVAAVVSGGALIVVIAGVVAGAITLVNGIVNLKNEIKASSVDNNDPATARRLSNQNTMQSYFREGDLTDSNAWVNQNVNKSRGLAMGIDVINIACSVVKIWDSAGKFIKNIGQWATENGGLMNGIKQIGHQIKTCFENNGFDAIKMYASEFGSSFKFAFNKNFNVKYVDVTSGKTIIKSVAGFTKTWAGLAKDVISNDEGFGGLLKIGIEDIALPSIIVGKIWSDSAYAKDPSQGFNFEKIAQYNIGGVRVLDGIKSITIEPIHKVGKDSIKKVIGGTIDCFKELSGHITIPAPGKLPNLDFQPIFLNL